MKDTLNDLVNSLDEEQLTNFITLFNSFYDNTKTIKSEYINVIHKDISISIMKKLETVKPVCIDRVGGMNLKWFKKIR